MPGELTSVSTIPLSNFDAHDCNRIESLLVIPFVAGEIEISDSADGVSPDFWVDDISSFALASSSVVKFFLIDFPVCGVVFVISNFCFAASFSFFFACFLCHFLP